MFDETIRAMLIEGTWATSLSAMAITVMRRRL